MAARQHKRLSKELGDLANDPITGENTTWQIPEYQPPTRPSTMSMLKDVINKKMKNINDGINNLTQQIEISVSGLKNSSFTTNIYLNKIQ